jgi:hypothetical protein
MRHSPIFAFLVILAITTVAAESERGDLKSVVAQRYPNHLTAFMQTHHLKERRQQAFVTLETAQEHYLVAAYSDGQIGALVLLKQAADGAYAVLHTIVDQHLEGASPEVRAIDLDGDGVPEIVVAFTLPRGGETSIFRISNHHLELISPTDEGGAPELGYPAILNFGSDGVKDLVEVSTFRNSGDEEPTVEYHHYVLQHGKYVITTPLDYYHVFYRDRHPRNTETEEFSIPKEAIGRAFHLTIINGGESTEEFRVPRAVVTLNGVKVSSGGDFSKDRSSWTIPVTLQEVNSIRVDLCASGNQSGEHADEESGGEGNQNCGERGRIAIAIHHD